MSEEVEGIDFIRRSRGFREHLDRSTSERDKFIYWVCEAYNESSTLFSSFQQLKITASAYTNGTCNAIGEQEYFFEAVFCESVHDKRVSTSWKYYFLHKPGEDTEDEPIKEKYVNRQLVDLRDDLVGIMEASIVVNEKILIISKQQ